MKQLDQKAVWLFFLRFLPAFIVFGFFMLFFLFPIVGIGTFFATSFFTKGEPNVFAWAVGILLLIVFYLLFASIFAYVWARLSYKYYRYELTDLGFKKEYGVIWKKYVTIPYERIQNVDIYRGLIARLLGLSDLQVQTAGMSMTAGAYGSGAEGRLPGLSPEVAEQLRDELVRRAQSKNQGL